MRRRRAEDRVSCTVLGASPKHLMKPDAIYRRAPGGGNHLYTSDRDVLGPVKLGDHGLVESLVHELALVLPATAQLVVPLALGGHVDHRLTRRVAEELNRPLLYYAEYPYVLRCTAAVNRLPEEGWESRLHHLTEQALSVWGAAVVAHASQLRSFWPNADAAREAIVAYGKAIGGVRLWRRLSSESLRQSSLR